jgi:hypothetical protein
MSPQKWIRETEAMGIVSKSGRYGGGTFAHPDIAFEFASWVSVEFRLYLIKEFERLKQDEAYRAKLTWTAQRELASQNYPIHTNAIKQIIIPTLTEAQKKYVYADEADLLNVALFGMRAGQWRKQNPDKSGNIRDYASTTQLKILVNLENLNAQMIKDDLGQGDRLEKLRGIVGEQMGIFERQEMRKLVKK